MTGADARRGLPSVDRVAEEVSERLGRSPAGALPRPLVVDASRRAVGAARDLVEGSSGGESVGLDAVVADAVARVESLSAALLRRLVNATGVVIHTNLGRAPLAVGSVSGALEVATGYSNLEYDVTAGERGSRHAHAGSLLAAACGAEAGLALNNNAAAVLLALAALARGKEVVVSRGELVEIGGGFRVPDVMAESGARLVEVGTTNRTRLADYAAAVGPDTSLVLKVHTSNYRMVGFVESTGIHELASLGVPVVFDVGSGLLDADVPWLPDGRPDWLGDEPAVRQSLADGAAVVTFSGDKLLGGPQAGVAVGRRDLVEAMARHPLARAVRADKLTLSALQSVALTYLSGSVRELPVWRMVTIDVADLRDRADRVASGIPGATPIDTEAVVGGGSLPGWTIPSAGVAVDASGERGDAVSAHLRSRGVVARVEHGRVVCDLRTVDPADDDLVADALRGAATA